MFMVFEKKNIVTHPTCKQKPFTTPASPHTFPTLVPYSAPGLTLGTWSLWRNDSWSSSKVALLETFTWSLGCSLGRSQVHTTVGCQWCQDDHDHDHDVDDDDDDGGDDDDTDHEDRRPSSWLSIDTTIAQWWKDMDTRGWYPSMTCDHPHVLVWSSCHDHENCQTLSCWQFRLQCFGLATRVPWHAMRNISLSSKLIGHH